MREDAVVLLGEIVELTTFTASNAEALCAMVNDPEIHRWMVTGQRTLSVDDELAFISASEEEREAGTAHRFEIHARDDGRLLGVCGLEHVDTYHRHAEIGIFIGLAEEWGKGFAADSIRTLLRFGFEELGLHSIRICVYPENERAHALYRRIGFTETGRDRESWLISGGMRDLIRLDILEDEYRELYG